MNEVRRRVAIITGAARGIGKAAFSRLRTEGVTVIGTDLLPDPEDQETQEESVSKNLDISLIHDVVDESSWVKVVDVTLEKYGQIDILANNAGGSGNIGLYHIEDISEELWDQIVYGNLKSVFLCCRGVVPHMKSRRSGKIVNFSSMTARGTFGPRGTSAGRLPYAGAKSGIIGFTTQLAKELG